MTFGLCQEICGAGAASLFDEPTTKLGALQIRVIGEATGFVPLADDNVVKIGLETQLDEQAFYMDAADLQIFERSALMASVIGAAS